MTARRPRPCDWPGCLTDAEAAELCDRITRESMGEDPGPLLPDPRPVCGCDEAGW